MEGKPVRRTRRTKALLAYGACNFSKARLYDNIRLVLADLRTLDLKGERLRKVRPAVYPYDTTWTEEVMHGIAAGIRYTIDTEGNLYLIRKDLTLKPMASYDIRSLPWYFFVRLQRQLRKSPKLHAARAIRAAKRHTPLPRS